MRIRNGIRVGILGLVVATAICPGVAVADDFKITGVVRGRVSVRDFAKKKTVTVRAGKKYVARAKKK